MLKRLKVQKGVKIMELSSKMEHGLMTKNFYLEHPKPRPTLIVLHGGHWDSIRSFGPLINIIMSNGFSVLYLSMPLIDTEKEKDFSNVHNLFFQYESPEFTGIKFFVDPIATCLNYILEKGQYQSVSMVGFSGGGWTTMLYSALDNRVKKGVSCGHAQFWILMREYILEGKVTVRLRKSMLRLKSGRACPGVAPDKRSFSLAERSRVINWMTLEPISWLMRNERMNLIL